MSRGTEGRPQTPESPTSHPGLGPAGPRTPAGSAGLARARRPLGAGGNRRPPRGFLKQSPETRPSSEFICSPVFYKAFNFPARPSGHSSVSLTSRHLRFGSREAGSHGDLSPSALRPASPGTCLQSHSQLCHEDLARPGHPHPQHLPAPPPQAAPPAPAPQHLAITAVSCPRSLPFPERHVKGILRSSPGSGFFHLAERT